MNGRQNSEDEDFNKSSLDHLEIMDQKKQNCLNSLQKHCLDFCRSTKLYGFSYLGDPTRTKIEKLYWLIFICISFILSITTMMHMWAKGKESPPVIVTKNHEPIWQIPFPAITVCPETKIRQSVYNFTEHYHSMLAEELTSSELQELSDLSLFCDNHLFRISGYRTSNFSNILRHLLKVAPPFEKVLFACKWLGNNETCSTLFSPLLTEDGLCFTFNMLNDEDLLTGITHSIPDFNNGEFSADWTLEDGYLKSAGKDTFPRRTLTAGSRGGIFLLLTEYDHDLDYTCRGPVQGFKVLLHQPTEMPRISSHYFRVPLNQEVTVNVKPELVTTDPSLKEYGAEKRQCFFAGERKLRFFKNYNQQNCKIECLTNYTLHRCGCVAFYMPHVESTPICGSGSSNCLSDAEEELHIREAKMDFDSDSCTCLPSCTSLIYHTETSQAHFQWTKVMQAFKSDVNEFPNLHMSRLTIFFKDMQFEVSERRKLHDNNNFLAHSGALLALFCGFSFLSVAEIIYFLSLRIVCNVRRYGGQFWAGSRNRLSNSAFLE